MKIFLVEIQVAFIWFKTKSKNAIIQRSLKVIGVLLAIVVVVVEACVLYINADGVPRYLSLVKYPGITVSSDSALVINGERLSSMLCAACHMNNKTSVLSGQHMPDVATFRKLISVKIPQDKKYGIGSLTDWQ